MMHLDVTITWVWFQLAGLLLAVLSIVALLGGTLPDNDGSAFWNGVRYIVWTLFVIWILFMLVKGIFF